MREIIREVLAGIRTAGHDKHLGIDSNVSEDLTSISLVERPADFKHLIPLRKAQAALREHPADKVPLRAAKSAWSYVDGDFRNFATASLPS